MSAPAPTPRRPVTVRPAIHDADVAARTQYELDKLARTLDQGMITVHEYITEAASLTAASLIAVTDEGTGPHWWVCRTCGHRIRRQNAAGLSLAITLHETVSHRGAEPIVAVE